jgi:hypothetical protein
MERDVPAASPPRPKPRKIGHRLRNDDLDLDVRLITSP